MEGWSRRAGWWLVLALGLGLAALLLALPGTVGGGEQIIDPSMLGALELRALSLLLLLRTVTTLVSYAAGTPGGVFAPMLALGTIVGMLVGRLAHPLLPAPWSMRSAWRSPAWQACSLLRCAHR